MENPIRIPSGYFSVFKIKLFKCLIIHFSSLVAICHSLIFFKISSLTSSLSSPGFQVKTNTISLISRNQMHMEMKYGLTCTFAIILYNIKSVTVQCISVFLPFF